MTQIISLDVPVAYALADLLENKAEELPAHLDHLNRMWIAFEMRWEGLVNIISR